MKLTRRQFLANGLRLSAALTIFPRNRAFAEPTEDPHFFLGVLPTPNAGWDTSYFFDARPLEMTSAKWIQNYLGTEPSPWVGTNGTATLATQLVKPLLPFRSDFSVLNGVYMSAIDGHDQNVSYLFTGATSGGPSFVPDLNPGGDFHKVIDAVLRGKLRTPLTNASGTVPFSVKAARNLVQNLKSLPVPSPSDPLFASLLAHYAELGQIDDTLGAGSGSMQSALSASPDLVRKILGLQIPDQEPDDDLSFVKLAGRLFQLGVTGAAILCLDPGKRIFDTHDARSASQQPAAFAQVADTLALILKHLKTTAFDRTRSLLDVTTFMITSEFGRTMRQNGQPIDATGTDHNTYSNTVILGGKGIRPGLVVGASDFRSSTEKLSPAHITVDGGKVHLMGKPFDFSKMVPRDDLPLTLDVEQFLNFDSIVNTVYRAFGVSTAKYRRLQNSGPIAPVLTGLLA